MENTRESQDGTECRRCHSTHTVETGPADYRPGVGWIVELVCSDCGCVFHKGVIA